MIDADNKPRDMSVRVCIEGSRRHPRPAVGGRDSPSRDFELDAIYGGTLRFAIGEEMYAVYVMSQSVSGSTIRSSRRVSPSRGFEISCNLRGDSASIPPWRDGDVRSTCNEKLCKWFRTLQGSRVIGTILFRPAGRRRVPP